MRMILVAALAAVTITPAAACNSELLTVVSWEAVRNDRSTLLPVLLKAQVRYEGERAYRMIHAGVMFSDVLGERLGQVNLGRDRPGSPGETLLADGQTGAKERIATINPDDVTYRTCVWSIVYDDGEVERFK